MTGGVTTSLDLVDVTVTHARRPAVHHVSGRFATGSLTAIVGPNGAGKTTLLRAIAGLHTLSAGRIEGAEDVALLPQGSALDRSFPLACLDVVAWGPTDQVLRPDALLQARLNAEAWLDDAAPCLTPQRTAA